MGMIYKMEERKIILSLTIEELKIIVYSLSSTQPISAELEASQFRLYHKLLARLNETK